MRGGKALLSAHKPAVTTQDSSLPAAVRKSFLCCGHGSRRLPCPQHKNVRAAVECRFIEHVRRGVRHLESYHVSSFSSGELVFSVPDTFETAAHREVWHPKSVGDRGVSVARYRCWPSRRVGSNPVHYRPCQ